MQNRVLRPSPTALLNPRCDASFKAMFTQNTKESNLALKDFISTLLNRKISNLALIPNEPPIDMLGEMQMSFDVGITFDDGERADLEMQSRLQKYDYATRAEIQAARLLNVNSRRGDNWTSPSAYQISVLNFEFDNNDKSPLAWYTMRKESGEQLAGKLNIIFFDLIKIRKMFGTSVEKLTKLQKWGLFLSYADSEKHRDYIKKLIDSEDGLMNANAALNMVSQDDINWAIENSIFKAQRDYNSNMQYAEKTGMERGLAKGMKQGMKQGLKQGIEQGLIKGARQKAIEAAQNFLRMGLSPEQVAQGTGMTTKEVLALKSKLDA